MVIEAKKYGYNIGLHNNIDVKTLHKRMLDMVEKRKNTLWNKKEDAKTITINYKFMSVPDLRYLCKERNLQNAHIKSKDGKVKLLEKNENIIVQTDKTNINYYKMTVKELKSLAKEKGFNSYNNLKKDDLIKLHEDNDNEDENAEEDENCLKISEFDQHKTNNLIDTFNFDGKELRIIGTCEDPWFIAKDICDILEISNNRDVLKKIPEKWKGVTFYDTLGGKQNMSIINESAVYKIIMRSNKPKAEHFQEFVCEDILPSIRKKGFYKLENESKLILQRPIKPILNLSDIDIEAETIEMNFDWSKYSNKIILYLSYIGDNLIKIGFSDCKLVKREAKHTSSESQYKQWRMLKVFEISGKAVEDKMKQLLKMYNVPFHKQIEIYKPPGTLTDFIQIVENLLKDNDIQMKYTLLQKEFIEMKLKYTQLEKEYLEIKYKSENNFKIEI